MKYKSLLQVVITMSKYTLFGIFLQCCYYSAMLASDGMAQQKSIHNIYVEVNHKNVDLEEALTFVEQNTNFKFVYTENIFNKQYHIKLEGGNQTLGDFLKNLSQQTHFAFKRIDNEIHIRQSVKTNPPVEEVFRNQDPVVISGKVTSGEDDNPLPGVNVSIKGSSSGTVTDINGEYKIKVKNENATLVFSYIGFVTEEIDINGRSVLNIVLFPDIQYLSELVVIGYGTQKKKDVTGSVGSIDNEDINSLPVPSISDAMQGRAAGVQVISKGEPGSDAEFRIRGTGTINNSNPLLVINGVPVTGGLNQLNPNDIKSVQVLKDASAAAIYGARGANGVVLVQTKSGSGDEPRFNIDYYTGVQEATNLVEMLNAAEFAAMHNDMMANAGLPKNPDFAEPASLGEGTDWIDELFKTAPMHNFSASYSGGNETSNYYISANYFDQEGIIIETGFKRYSLQFNSDHKVKEWLRFGNNLTLNHDVKTRGDYSIKNTLAALPTQPVFDPDGSYSGPVGQPSFVGDIINPIGKAKLVDQKTSGYNVIGSLFGEVEIIDHLKFKTTGGIQANFWDDRTWAPAYDWEPTPEDDSYLYEAYNKNITWLWDNTLTYDRAIGENHNLTVLLGSSAQANRYDNMNGSIKDFASDRTQQLDNGSATPTLGGNASEWSLLSYFGRANYAFQDKYLITGTVRYDGSSRFGEGNKYGLFPSGAVAWRISNEDIFSGINVVNDLKLRAGYGLTGNQEIGNYPFASTLQTVQYTFNGQLVSSVVPSVMPNPDVHWETVEQANIGVDATILDNRINLTAEAYLKNTKDMLVPQDVPVSTGYSDILVPEINAGKIRNKGIELDVKSFNFTGDLEWTTDFNISYNQNEVISLNDTVPLSRGSIGFNYTLARIQAGQPVNSFFGYVTNGIFQTEEQARNHATQVDGADPFNRTSAGDIRFADLNDDGVIDDEDRTFIGNPNPDFIYAMNNTFTYKGIDLSIFIQGVYGNDIVNANLIWSEAMAIAQNQTTTTRKRWQGEGTSNDVPRAIFNDPNKNTRFSDRYVEDGSYLRIKNVTLGYALPEHLIKSVNLTQARIYASVQNLLTFTNYNGFDPEVPSNGIDFNVYPVTRTISFGVNLSF